MLSGSKTWSPGTINLNDDSAPLQPHPPREKSAEKSRRVVRVRPSSGKKESDSGKESEKENSQSDNAVNLSNSKSSRTENASYSNKSKNNNEGALDAELSDELGNKKLSEKSRTAKVEFRSSREPKIYLTEHGEVGNKLSRVRNYSESSEKESDAASNPSDVMKKGSRLERRRGQGDSMSESDDIHAHTSGARKQSRSRIPRRKKRSERGIGLMDSLSENEEVRYQGEKNGKLSLKIYF